MNLASPYYNAEEAAIVLRYVHADGTPDVHNLRRFLKRQRVVPVVRGRRNLYRKDEVAAVLFRRSA